MHVDAIITETLLPPPAPPNRVHPVLRKHAVELARAAIHDHFQKDGGSYESEFIRQAVTAYLKEMHECKQVDHTLGVTPDNDGDLPSDYREAHRAGYDTAVEGFDQAAKQYMAANGSTPGVADLLAEIREQAFDA